MLNLGRFIHIGPTLKKMCEINDCHLFNKNEKVEAPWFCNFFEDGTKVKIHSVIKPHLQCKVYTICENTSNSIAVIHTLVHYLFFIDKSPFNSTYIQCYNQLHNKYLMHSFFSRFIIHTGLISRNWIIFLTIHSKKRPVARTTKFKLLESLFIPLLRN